PKALMAAGSIYAEWAQRDSLDLLGSIPVSIPDSLLQAIGLSSRRTRVVPDTTALASTGGMNAALLAAQSGAEADSLRASEGDEALVQAGDSLRPGDVALLTEDDPPADTLEVALPPEVTRSSERDEERPAADAAAPDSIDVAEDALEGIEDMDLAAAPAD